MQLKFFHFFATQLSQLGTSNKGTEVQITSEAYNQETKRKCYQKISTALKNVQGFFF